MTTITDGEVVGAFIHFLFWGEYLVFSALFWPSVSDANLLFIPVG